MFSPASLLTALALAAAGVHATFDVAIFSGFNCGGTQLSVLHLQELGDCLKVFPAFSWKVLNAPGVTCQAFTEHNTNCNLNNEISNPAVTFDGQGNACGTTSTIFGSLICA